MVDELTEVPLGVVLPILLHGKKPRFLGIFLKVLSRFETIVFVGKNISDP